MTDIEFKRLAKDYGFTDAEKLELYVGCAHWLKDQRTVPKQRKAIEKVHKHSKGLREALEDLGFFETKNLQIEFDEADKLIKLAVKYTEQLEDITGNVASRLKSHKKPIGEIWSFVMDMADFWYKEKGKVPRCYPSSHSDSGFDGEFYHFILECSDFTGKQGSNINKIIKKWKKSNGISTK